MPATFSRGQIPLAQLGQARGESELEVVEPLSELGAVIVEEPVAVGVVEFENRMHDDVEAFAGRSLRAHTKHIARLQCAPLGKRSRHTAILLHINHRRASNIPGSRISDTEGRRRTASKIYSAGDGVWLDRRPRVSRQALATAKNLGEVDTTHLHS